MGKIWGDTGERKGGLSRPSLLIYRNFFLLDLRVDGARLISAAIAAPAILVILPGIEFAFRSSKNMRPIAMHSLKNTLC